ncbi:MAG: hypothetical protein U5Q03_06210 [Bacteroidota bacterium]|nr:hypothetical protein [Bacteroidota bacterium]
MNALDGFCCRSGQWIGELGDEGDKGERAIGRPGDRETGRLERDIEKGRKGDGEKGYL